MQIPSVELVINPAQLVIRGSLDCFLASAKRYIAVFYELSNRMATTPRFIASLPSTNPTTLLSLSPFCLPFCSGSTSLVLLARYLLSRASLLLFLDVSTSVVPCFSAIQPSRSCYHD
jgi:hypothetical protein